MSRSPLMGWLRRAVAVAGASARTGQPAADVLGAAREARRSRRRFLAESARAGIGLGIAGLGCAGLGGGAAHAGDPPAADTPARRPGAPRVAIIGGGLAGMTAAYTLAQAGLRAQLFEGSTRLGGRTSTAQDLFAPDTAVELGGEFVNTDHVETHALCEELGLERTDLLALYPDALEDESHFGGALRSEDDIIGALAPFLATIAVDRARSGGFAADQPAAAELDALSLRAYLERLGIDGWLRDLVEVSCVTEYGLDAEEQSAQYLIQWVGLDLEEAGLHLSSDERFTVRGGMQEIARRIHARLDDGQVRLGARLEAIRPAGPAGAGVRLAFAADAGAPREVEVDLAILALPFTLLREVEVGVELSERKRRAIRDLGYGTNAKLLIGTGGAPWRDHGFSGAVTTDLGYQMSWENGLDRGGPPRGLTLYTGGRIGVEVGAGSAEEQVERHLGALETTLPGLRAARTGKVARCHWPTQPWAKGSYACYRPGQWTSIRGVEREPEGPLHFAGEHTSLRCQGFMNGAVESGRRAAGEVLARAGIASPARGG